MSAVDLLRPYLAHKPDCATYGTSRFPLCSCGLIEALIAARRLEEVAR